MPPHQVENSIACITGDLALLHSVFTSMSEGVVIHAPDGRVIEANPAAEIILGLTRDQLLGRTSLDPRWMTIHEDGTAFPGDEHPAMVTLRTGKPAKNQLMGVQIPTGELRWISINSSLLLNADTSAPVGVVATFTDISANKQSEAALLESKQRLADAQAIAQLGSWNVVFGQSSDQDKWVISEELRAIYGYSGDEQLTTETGFIPMPPEDLQRTRRAWEKAKRGEGPFEWHHRILVGEKIKWLHVRSKFTFDEAGNAIQASGTSQDITDRKNAEEALAQRESQIRSIIEGTSDAVYLKDLEGRYLLANNATCRFVGKTLSEIIGHDDTNLFPPDDARAIMATDRKVLDSNKVSVLEERVRTAGGATTTFHSTKGPVYDSEGKAIGLFGIARDITQDKILQDKLQLAASVFANARDGIMITDLQGKIIEINDAFCRITGFSSDDVVGQTPRVLKSGLQEKDFYSSMWESMANKGHWYGEIWNRRKNGEVYAVMETVSTVYDADGNPKCYIALFSDITALKNHQKQLERIAHYDALTGLPNRLLFGDRLQQAMAQADRREEPINVAFIDLDGFKAVNDKHGHEVGDQLLIKVATRMKESIRDGDTLARIGGDEFVAILTDLLDQDSSEATLHRLLAAAAEPVHVGDLILQVSASIGVALYPQAASTSGTDLLKQADTAMYEAKRSGRNCWCIFDILEK